jgi:hypothetical protein
MIRTVFAIAMMLTLHAVAAGSALAAEETVVTVTGAVTKPNRPAFDAFADGVFAHDGISFDKAHAFTRDALVRLGMKRTVLSYPNWSKPIAFRGPTLAAVLAAAGAAGKTVTVQALDGYFVDFPWEFAQRSDVILAVEADGLPLGLGGRGPAWLVFPPGVLPNQEAGTDSGLVWAAFHIKVE